MPRALVRHQALPDVARIVPTPGRYRTAALLLIACKTENAIEKGKPSNPLIYKKVQIALIALQITN